MSRLPLQYNKDASVKDKIFQVSVVQLHKHPVSVLEIAHQTLARNQVLAKAPVMIQNGRPIHFCTTPELKPFFLCKDELSVKQGFLMWELRSITPLSLQEQILSELHTVYPRVARMKAAARSHVWWPGTDNNIAERACGCKQCLRKAPQVAPLSPWSWPTAPWQCIHVDCHQSNHYLILV